MSGGIEIAEPRLRSVKTMDDWIAFHRDPSKFAALSGGDQ